MITRSCWFGDCFHWKLLSEYTTCLGCMAAAVLPASPTENQNQVSLKTYWTSDHKALYWLSGLCCVIYIKGCVNPLIQDRLCVFEEKQESPAPNPTNFHKESTTASQKIRHNATLNPMTAIDLTGRKQLWLRCGEMTWQTLEWQFCSAWHW